MVYIISSSPCLSLASMIVACGESEYTSTSENNVRKIASNRDYRTICGANPSLASVIRNVQGRILEGFVVA